MEFLKERITVDHNGSPPPDSLMFGLVFGVMASFAQVERGLIRERQGRGNRPGLGRGKYALD